jgi:formamidopyrimidine-DNA glycosylase
MPELPEVETIRRLLQATVVGRRVAAVALSGARLREPVSRRLPARLAGRRIDGVRRVGKYLLLDFERDLTLLAHLGMTGRFLFFAEPPAARMAHVHARIRFEDGSQLWFQDPRRFGLLSTHPTSALARVSALAALGADPLTQPLRAEYLYEATRRSGVEAKNFLMDQRRIAGLGNIYVSEVLHRSGVHPRARACDLTPADCEALAREVSAVLDEAIRHCGTTFSDYATLWGEPGSYAQHLCVYDRGGEPCRSCGRTIERIVQGQRSTFFCPSCQPRRRSGRRAPARRRAVGTHAP